MSLSINGNSSVPKPGSTGGSNPKSINFGLVSTSDSKNTSVNNAKSDGIFTIKQGQGITHALVEEIGLSAEQANSLGNEYWSKIMSEIDKQKAETQNLYSGGNDINGSSRDNYVVQSGQAININLTGIWDNILNIVNNKLGTNFKSENSENEATAMSNQNTSVPTSNQELTQIILNEPQRPDLAGKESNGKHYDKNGNLSLTFANGKIETNIARDESGDIKSITKFDSKDLFNSVTYNKEGDVIEYSEHVGDNVIYRDGSGNITSFAHHTSDGGNYMYEDNHVYSFSTIKSDFLGENTENTSVPTSNQELTQIILNEPQRPDLAGKESNGKHYDKNGNLSLTFANGKIETNIARDESGDIKSITKFDSKDLFNSVTYNKEGDVIEYSEHVGDNVIYRDGSGNITSFAHHTSDGGNYMYEDNHVYSFNTLKSDLLSDDVVD